MILGAGAAEPPVCPAFCGRHDGGCLHAPRFAERHKTPRAILVVPIATCATGRRIDREGAENPETILAATASRHRGIWSICQISTPRRWSTGRPEGAPTLMGRHPNVGQVADGRRGGRGTVGFHLPRDPDVHWSASSPLTYAGRFFPLWETCWGALLTVGPGW